jgi:hypothetical protein
MATRIAKLGKSSWDAGAVIYESVSMSAFVPIFRNTADAQEFLDWLREEGRIGELWEVNDCKLFQEYGAIPKL